MKEPDRTTIELSHRYISILRCATWHVWPEYTSVLSRIIRVPIAGQSELFLYGSIHLVSYEKRHRVKAYPAKESKESESTILWRGILKSRHLIGESLVQAPEDVQNYTLHFEKAYRGEIDVQFHFGSEQELPWEELKQTVSNISFSAMALVNLELGDLLRPAAPIHILKIVDNQLQVRHHVPILVWKRGCISKADLQQAVDKCASILTSRGSSDSTGGKLRVALELYAAHFYERTMSTRFLMLVMALETLTPSTLKSQIAVDLLDDWKQQVSSLKSSLAEDSEEHSALEDLERELLFRRERSIRGQIRAFVHTVFSTAGDPKAVDRARQAVRVYDQRSELVHEGALPVGDLPKAEAGAKEILELVLKASFASYIPDAKLLYAKVVQEGREV